MSAPAAISPAPIRPAGRLATACVVALAALLVAALSLLLWPQWRENPDLSHGLLAPVIFLLLLHESRRHGPWRWLPETPAIKIARAASILAGLVLTALGGLFAAAVDWSHALVGMTLACALTMLLLAALLWLASDTTKSMPFNWTSLVAVGLWPLCAPIPPGTYQRVTLAMQMWVVHGVVGVFNFLGIAAASDGTIIQLARATVGVEEACSGVRSLVSCVVAGLFFASTLVRKPWKRALLVALSAPLAVGMNFLRSLLLTLFADKGIDIRGPWHDATGFAVLGLTTLLLGGLALWLQDRAPDVAPAKSMPRPATSRRWGVPAGLLAAVLLVVFFALATRDTSRPGASAPDLAAILPAAIPGWNVATADDLYQFVPVLRTDHLIQRDYSRILPDGSPERITIYLAYWPPGQVTVSLVSSHTPDACWPGTGWKSMPRLPAPSPFLAGGRALPAPEFRTFAYGRFLENVWYWHLYAGRPIVQIDPRSPRALLRLALRYGFHKAGDQLFIRISGNRPWDDIRDTPPVLETLSRLQPLGL